MYVETEVSTLARHEHARRVNEIEISSYMYMGGCYEYPGKKS